VKRMNASRCDYLFVHVGDGRRWFIPSIRVEGTTGYLSRRAEVRGVRGRSGSPADPRKCLYNRRLKRLGGMSEWLKEMRCKRIGSAYAGSNPAPPIPQASIRALSNPRRAELLALQIALEPVVG
jgi:hypothetical protein